MRLEHAAFNYNDTIHLSEWGEQNEIWSRSLRDYQKISNKDVFCFELMTEKKRIKCSFAIDAELLLHQINLPQDIEAMEAI